MSSLINLHLKWFVVAKTHDLVNAHMGQFGRKEKTRYERL